MIRDVQRELRDEFTERLAELQRTYTETAKRAQEDARADPDRNARSGRPRSTPEHRGDHRQVEQAAAGAGA